MKYLLTCLIVASCASSPKLDIDSIYKRETKFEVDGRKYTGIANLTQRDQYRFDIDLPQKPALLKLSTCHREVVIQKPGKDYQYTYMPTSLEKSAPCPMDIIALDEKGENSWAFIDFKLPDELLTAKIGCNGNIFSEKGSAICQAKAGLVQSISFDKIVKGKGPTRCPELSSWEDNSFEYVIAAGVCQYVFTDGKTIFRLTTFGYSDVLIHD